MYPTAHWKQALVPLQLAQLAGQLEQVLPLRNWP
jgi:hypothetical protein